jgi:hypothetical protein
VNGEFDTETLQLLGETEEIRIETRRDEISPAHRTTIWVVTVDGSVFVRSVRGEKGRWYRKVSANPSAALHADDRRIPVRAVPVTDEQTIEAVSEAYRSEYGRTWPGPSGPCCDPRPCLQR